MNASNQFDGSQKPTAKLDKKIVVIATFNERDNISPLVSRILDLKPDFHVLVIDDDSPDGTGKIVSSVFSDNPRVRLVTRTGKKGYASAVMQGLQEALQWDGSRILTLDADFSHNPEDLPLLDAALAHYQLAIGSRYLNGIRILNWSPGRLLLSLAANVYVRTVLGLPYSDCTSGFRGYRREVVEQILSTRVKSNGYAFLVEVLAVTAKAGWRAQEIPIIYTERRAGQSKMSKLSIIEAIFLPWRILLRPSRKKR